MYIIDSPSPALVDHDTVTTEEGQQTWKPVGHETPAFGYVASKSKISLPSLYSKVLVLSNALQKHQEFLKGATIQIKPNGFSLLMI